jgi:general secretion pathway protein J
MIRNDAGFTLLEALVATTLTAMLAAVLFGSVSIGVRVMDSGTKRADAATQIALAQNFLRNHLAQAQPVFEGRSDGIAFLERAPELPPIGLKRMSVRAERTRDGLRLVADWAAPKAAVHQSLLLERLASIEFAYFGSDEPARAPTWRSEWRSSTAVPTLVRLRVGFGADRAPQEFIVALRLA